MILRKHEFCLCSLLACAIPGFSYAQGSSRLDEAFSSYWSARTGAETDRAIDAIIATGASYDSIEERLRLGRHYSWDVPKGRLELSRLNDDGLEHRYVVLVPDDYDPDRRYPVRFYLHGGVERPEWSDGGDWWPHPERMAGSEWISVFPSSWRESLWWQESQVENFREILDALKHNYNVDENRAHLIGISDGGTGAYFEAFRATTLWAGFLPLISSPAVLANPNLGVDGQMHVINITNKPLFVVTGGQDRLYPTRDVLPFVELFRLAGATVVFRPKNQSGHDVRWWSHEAARIDSFIAYTVRDPYPSRVRWETERTDRYNRAHWIVITELGSSVGESTIDDFNSVHNAPALGIEPMETGGLGVRVLLVDSGSVAEAAGIVEHDIIVSVNGVATETVQQLAAVLQAGTYGATMPITIVRDGQTIDSQLRFPEAAMSASQVFPRTAPSGRIDVVRNGNAVNVSTTGVVGFTLLISSDVFDLGRPVNVTVNDIDYYNRTVEPNTHTLLEWAASDNDRSMLFAAEIPIRLKPARD